MAQIGLNWLPCAVALPTTEAPAMRIEKQYPCCPDQTIYSAVEFTLHLRRKTLYYVFNLIIPCALISTITFLVFALCTESGERVAMSQLFALLFSSPLYCEQGLLLLCIDFHRYVIR